MPVNSLSYGVPTTLVQNTVYAMPAARAIAYITGGVPVTGEGSNSSDMSNPVAVTLTNATFEVSMPFIRVTSGNTTLTIKK